MNLFDLIKRKFSKKEPVKTGNRVVDFYNIADEDPRLLTKHGKVEFLTTVKYVENYLKDGMKIIEIGAATGRYSHYFAQKGFEVDSVELVERNIEIFKKNTKPGEKITIRQGNALDLSDFADNTYDITLLLGPMYHLYTPEDQKKALSEAIRITKRGGVIFVAYLMMDSCIMAHFRNKKIQVLIDEGFFNPDTLETKCPPEGIFKLNYIEEINELSDNSDAKRLKLIGTDGIAEDLAEQIAAMDDKTYDLFIRYHLSVCEKPELLGISHHALDILRKKMD